MALSANTIWEIRSSATAGNINSGGFVSGASGTDYSQQDASQYNGTDLASTNGTTNPSVITSASHNFVAADVGNIIFISAGTNWTAGRYQIVSCAANAATLDRAVGSAATLSSGTYRVGGALSLASADDAIFELGVAGNKYYVKGGATYTIGGAVSIAAAGSTLLPIKIIGYTTARNDVCTGANRPIFACAGNAFSVGGNWDLNNIIFTTSNANGITGASAGNQKFINCKITNTSTSAGLAGILVQPQMFIYSCEIISYRGIGVSVTSTSTCTIMNCYIHDCNTGITDTTTAQPTFYTGNIIANCVTAAIQFTGVKTSQSIVSENTLYGAENKLGIGISIATGLLNIRAMNNIIAGFVTGISHADTNTHSFDDFNAYYNNTNDVNDVTKWVKGSTDSILNPTFTSVAQLTGTAATSATNVLTVGSGTPFGSIIDNQDYIYLVSGSGTGFAANVYLITAHTSTTVTVSSNITSSGAGTSIVWQVTTGRNFGIGTNLKGQGFSGSFPGALTTGYVDIGAVQRQEITSYTRGRLVNEGS